MQNGKGDKHKEKQQTYYLNGTAHT